jgi:drug/metabolite transporter (DMT)-like permease
MMAASGTRPATVRIILAFAAVYLIWGSTYLGIRVAIETIPPFIMAGARFLIPGIILYIGALAAGAPRPTAAQWRAGAVVGALLPMAGNGAVVWAELRNPSGLTALFVAQMPACMALLEWLRPGGRRPRGWVFAGLVLGTAGVALLIDPSAPAAGVVRDRIDLAAALALLCGAFAWAGGSLYAREAPLPASPAMATALQMLTGGTFLLTFGALRGELAHFSPAAVTPRSALAFTYLFSFGSLVGFTAYAWLLRVVSPTKVSTYAYVNPVVAVLLGWLIAGEPMTSRTVTAGGLIIAAVVVITTARGHQAAPREASIPEAGEAA